MAKWQTPYFWEQTVRFSLLLCALPFFAISMANAQNNKWPVSLYGSNSGSYAIAPVLNGYLIVNSRDLKGLIHRTYLKGTLLDTLVNNDTLYGRIKLYYLNMPHHIDIELPKSNVVSVPSSYIQSIVGTSSENLDAPLTRWIIVEHGKYPPFGYPPFGRLIAQKNKVLIFDNSDKDTAAGDYSCPMILRNGTEEITIFDRFRSTIGTLRKFIKRRYGIDLDRSKAESKDVHYLINFIAEEENSRIGNQK